MNNYDENRLDLQQIRLSIDETRRKIGLKDALNRLSKNEDFKEIFTDNYLSEYPLMLIENKANITMQSPVNQTFIEGQLNGIGYLKNYLSLITIEGSACEDKLQEYEQEEATLMQEQTEGGGE